MAPPDRLASGSTSGPAAGGSGAGWRPPARRRRRAASSATLGRRPPGPAHSNAGTPALAPCQSTLCAGSRSSPAWARSASRPLDAERIAPPFPVRRVHVASFSRGARHVHRLVEHHRHPDRLAEQVRVAPRLARRDRPPRKPRVAPPPPKYAQRRPGDHAPAPSPCARLQPLRRVRRQAVDRRRRRRTRRPPSICASSAGPVARIPPHVVPLRPSHRGRARERPPPDSRPRPRPARLVGQKVARTAARSGTPNGRACPRFRLPAVRR